MMANPFDEGPQRNYGSVSGQGGRGFSRESSGSDSEFHRMRNTISHACSEINSQTNELKSLCKKIGGRQDDAELRQRILAVRKAAFENVETTTETFNTLMTRYGRSNDREHTIAIESLQKNFSRIANEFSQAYERIVGRLQENPRPRVTDSVVNTSASDDTIPILEAEQQLHEQDQIHVSYTEQRAEAVENLASEMLHLQDIMNSINNMVVEQGETIDNIEAHVERAAVEVESGRVKLGAAARYKRCNRRLSFCIFLIILAIVIAIIVTILIFTCGVAHACKK
ncbi:PREDICTED: syntaxin pep12-like [Amphimedon queenslandica]|uniref:t-SNARE coiled-coil homology domain-containing protein n=1 Tax=Amphimedon queenslandica TaxID=400682 RepID=A0A1X7VGG0_AMPQE|nr:PREDICTED: syntaxin pep12-like [Amphimedon queenslandica]|eukprot:XP_019849002.1 PREDICTED: syntaxin pep12-like [Amphimedon queenslandica]